MPLSRLRCAMCCWLAILFPAQTVLAGETAVAMVYTSGAASLNGNEAQRSEAVFAGDVLETKADATASIQATGSNVLVLPDTQVKFDGPTVEIDHGAVRVTTERGLAAVAGDVTVKPASNSWTEFQVTDVDGRVQIAANKGDVTVQDDKGTTTVTQGQQTTRDDTSDTEKKKKKRRAAGAAVGAGGGIMSSTAAIAGGLGVVAGVGVWIWLQNGAPVSPACPTNPCQ